MRSGSLLPYPETDFGNSKIFFIVSLHNLCHWYSESVFFLRVWARGGEVVQNFARNLVLLSKCLCFESFLTKIQGGAIRLQKSRGGASPPAPLTGGSGETLIQTSQDIQP